MDTQAPSESERILVVEDDLKLAQLVREFLEKSGYQVHCVHRGDEALDAVVSFRPALLILDIMLPGVDGISICRELRPQFDGAIVMLTARGEDFDEVVGLEVGADDYLAKPVRPRVLLARVRALLRRVHPPPYASEARQIQADDLLIDSGARKVWIDGHKIDLTGAEFALLWILAQQAGTPVSRNLLSEETRGVPYDGLDRTIDLRVASLRSKLGDVQKPPTRILSIRGVGYQLALRGQQTK